ncbi:MAG: zinc-ribbon domain-containing protein [Deltaproteobacteria bacterium]|nr:zinc-ribbon domain-containing protein [Deltaproteobacteria bacterium]
MIVQCTNCRTKFRLPDEKIGATGTKVRCSRCGSVFLVERSAEQPFAAIDDPAAFKGEATTRSEAPPAADRAATMRAGLDPFGDSTQHDFPPTGTGGFDRPFTADLIGSVGLPSTDTPPPAFDQTQVQQNPYDTDDPGEVVPEPQTQIADRFARPRPASSLRPPPEEAPPDAFGAGASDFGRPRGTVEERGFEGGLDSPAHDPFGVPPGDPDPFGAAAWPDAPPAQSLEEQFAALDRLVVDQESPSFDGADTLGGDFAALGPEPGADYLRPASQRGPAYQAGSLDSLGGSFGASIDSLGGSPASFGALGRPPYDGIDRTAFEVPPPADSDRPKSAESIPVPMLDATWSQEPFPSAASADEARTPTPAASASTAYDEAVTPLPEELRAAPEPEQKPTLPPPSPLEMERLRQAAATAEAEARLEAAPRASDPTFSPPSWAPPAAAPSHLDSLFPPPRPAESMPSIPPPVDLSTAPATEGGADLFGGTDLSQELPGFDQAFDPAAIEPAPPVRAPIRAPSDAPPPIVPSTPPPPPPRREGKGMAPDEVRSAAASKIRAITTKRAAQARKLIALPDSVGITPLLVGILSALLVGGGLFAVTGGDPKNLNARFIGEKLFGAATTDGVDVEAEGSRAATYETPAGTVVVISGRARNLGERSLRGLEVVVTQLRGESKVEERAAWVGVPVTPPLLARLESADELDRAKREALIQLPTSADQLTIGPGEALDFDVVFPKRPDDPSSHRFRIEFRQAKLTPALP